MAHRESATKPFVSNSSVHMPPPLPSIDTATLLTMKVEMGLLSASSIMCSTRNLPCYSAALFEQTQQTTVEKLL